MDKSVAQGIAERLLADGLPRRWRHVQAVAGKAATLAWVLPVHDQQVVLDSAWLHDVGYADGVVDTGLHALDGARWLKSCGIDTRVVALVAYHSCAVYEAQERGLGDVLRAEFRAEESAAADLLWYADMTTGPDGEDLNVLERLAEVRQRYGPEDVVSRFWTRAEPVIVDVVRRVERRIAAAGAQPM